MKNIYSILFLLVLTQMSAQVTFNSRVHFDYFAAVATSVVPHGDGYYLSGVVVDTVPPYNTGSFFANIDLEGGAVSVRPLVSTEKTYGAWFNTLTSLSDGSFMLTGVVYDTIENTILLNLNEEGDTISIHEYANPFYPTYAFMQPRGGLGLLPDGGYIISNWIDHGDPFDDPNAEVYVLRTDSLGSTQWDTVFEYPTWDRPTSLVVDGAGNTILGWVSSNINSAWTGLESRARLTKVNGDGDVLWEYTTPESVGLRDAPNDMVLLGDGSLVIASGVGTEIEHPAGNRLFFEKMLFKLSPDNEIEWETIFEAPEFTSQSKLTNVVEVSDGSGFVVAGMEGEDTPGINTFEVRGWVAKVSPFGEKVWERRYMGFGGDQPRHEVFDLEECLDGGFILVGESRDGTGDTYPPQQAWLLKLDEHGCLVPGCHLIDAVGEAEGTGLSLAIYPNPATDYLNFQLRGGHVKKGSFQVVDMAGKVVRRFPKDLHANDTYIVPVWDWPTGAYILQCLDKEGRIVASARVVAGHR